MGERRGKRAKPCFFWECDVNDAWKRREGKRRLRFRGGSVAKDERSREGMCTGALVLIA